jgi:hypothetical protein
VPEFWEWLKAKGENGQVKIPSEVADELREGRDQLSRWMKARETKAALELSEEPDQALVATAIETYADDLTDIELVKLGRDPFLIGYCLIDVDARCVVTTEVSKPTKQRANRHLPDVCEELGVAWCNTFELTRRLDFRTSWR